MAALFRRADLSERYRMVITRHYGNDETRAAIAADLGVSGNRVGEMVAAAREKLRAVAG